MSYVPRISDEVRELISLARNNKNLAKRVTEFLEDGLPFVRADVDGLSTSSTGDRVLTYHLPDELKVLVATAKAGKLDAIDIPAGG